MTLEDLETDRPFSFKSTKNGQVRISYKGKTVTSLVGREADKFMARIEFVSEKQAQLVMAKATGHFKRGNEKQPKNSR